MRTKCPLFNVLAHKLWMQLALFQNVTHPKPKTVKPFGQLLSHTKQRTVLINIIN